MKRKFSSISIYKVALLAGDAAATMGAFALGFRGRPQDLQFMIDESEFGAIGWVGKR